MWTPQFLRSRKHHGMCERNWILLVQGLFQRKALREHVHRYRALRRGEHLHVRVNEPSREIAAIDRHQRAAYRIGLFGGIVYQFGVSGFPVQNQIQAAEERSQNLLAWLLDGTG